jgi:hypothetical protein
MRKKNVIFIDTSAWLAVIDEKNTNHKAAGKYFEKLLETNPRLITNNLIVDDTLLYLKTNYGSELARKFLAIIDESTMSVNLLVDWVSRRIRRIALDSYLKSSNANLTIKHFYIFESLKRKKIDLIFSFDQNLKDFGYPVMPQKA